MVNIAVIGAGTAGLCAAKTALQHGCEVTVFELSKQVGGTWVYSDQTGKDEYGLDIHTSMYQGLQYVPICILNATITGNRENIC